MKPGVFGTSTIYWGCARRDCDEKPVADAKQKAFDHRSGTEFFCSVAVSTTSHCDSVP
jgi:hypothetical protein